MPPVDQPDDEGRCIEHQICIGSLRRDEQLLRLINCTLTTPEIIIFRAGNSLTGHRTPGGVPRINHTGLPALPWGLANEDIHTGRLLWIPDPMCHRLWQMVQGEVQSMVPSNSQPLTPRRMEIEFWGRTIMAVSRASPRFRSNMYPHKAIMPLYKISMA